MEKADYNKIAGSYDQGRFLSEQNIDLWIGLILKYARAAEGARLLDLGCGTGRFSIPIAEKLRYSVTGADSSPDMLDIARQKDRNRIVNWEVRDAQYLTYPDASFDVIFMSHLLHHCDNPRKVIDDCWRILDERGAILIRHGAIEQIRDDVEHTFFPETLAIDEARVFTVKKLENYLKDAGFSGVVSEEVTQQTYATSTDHLKAVTVKSTSVLTMIPPDAFAKGISRFQKHIAKDPDDPWLLFDKVTLTAGYKRRKS
jgi:ubiquinone/menaquinone biosynthesis C-methylase UbiE